VEPWQAVVLGLIEGLTEFLPVSSTGHLLVAQRLMGIAAGDAADAYVVIIQMGAIVALVGLYRQRLLQLLRGLLALPGRPVPAARDGQRLLLHLILGFAPLAGIGLLLGKPLQRLLFGPWPVVVAWALGGAVLLAIAPRLHARAGNALEGLTPRAALWIGLAQCAALWPGVSRSLATLLGGLAVGLSLPAAVEFSFLLGLCTLTAAALHEIVKHGSVLLAAYPLQPILIGIAVAWLSAVLAVRWMLAWLKHRGLSIFGWWRLAAAALTAWFLLRGTL
jgi:undecaprenyl-diphosphatase